MHSSWRLVVALVTLGVAGLARAAEPEGSPPRADLRIANFEGPNYGLWTATGEAFGTGPAQGTLPNQMQVSGYLGERLVNSFLGGDGTTGTLTSPTILLDRKFLHFLVGGGNHPDETCVNLLVDGKRVRTACSSASGGSEHLEETAWDVSEFAGKEAVIEIVDRHTGGWGHVNADHFVLSDKPLAGWQLNPQRALVVSQRYLHLPIENGATQRKMTVSVAGVPQRTFDIELADERPDWWAFLDLDEWQGRNLTIAVDKLREGSQALAAITQSDELPGAGELYREALRPQFHFSARRGWLNDPNGLVNHNGVYHLFFQHNPYGWNWGNMHWGHATSPDLVHWTEHPIAIYPDELGTAFSGSAVVDEGNTSGLQTGAKPPLVCIYTAAGKEFTQCLSYSNDAGQTWTKFAGNPVLKQLAPGNRDPKVFWHEPTSRWIMALYLEKNDFAIFASPDLKKWEKLSDLRIPGTIECPELFELPAGKAGQGKADSSRWIFYGANGGYLVGQFDGTSFTTESGPHALHHGNCFYASQTYTNIPAKDGRRILIPWGQVALPGMPFNQMMGLPVVLTLHETAAGPRMFVEPVKELESLRTKTHDLPAGTLSPGDNPLADVSCELAEIVVDFEPGAASEVVLNLRGLEIFYDAKAGVVRCLDKQAPLASVDGKLSLRMFVDRASVDIFGGAGALYMPMGHNLVANNRSFSMTTRGGAAQVRSLVVHELQSAWQSAGK